MGRWGPGAHYCANTFGGRCWPQRRLSDAKKRETGRRKQNSNLNSKNKRPERELIIGIDFWKGAPFAVARSACVGKNKRAFFPRRCNVVKLLGVGQGGGFRGAGWGRSVGSNINLGSLCLETTNKNALPRGGCGLCGR